MTQPAFLTQFAEKMNQLNVVRGNIQSSIKSKEEFASKVKVGLAEVKTRLQKLAELINDLKTNATRLETQINTNTSSITGKEQELQQLRNTIAAITTERDALKQQLAKQGNEAAQQIAAKQKQIDSYEAQLRDIQPKYKAQTDELTALREEMSKTGNDKDAAHAAQIQQITDQSLQQLKQRETELMQRITDCEGKIANFEQQLKDKDAALMQKQKELEEATNQSQTSAQGLQTQIDALKHENDQLVQRLIAATNAIAQAADDLQTLMSAAPNAQNKQEIDALLEDINKQIEASMQNIGRAAQGQPNQYDVDANYANLINLYKLPDKTAYKRILRTINSGQIENLIDSNIKPAVNGNATAINNIKRELSTNQIKINAPRIIGGNRRTRKQKKQTGGFTYNTGSKRKSVSSKSITKSSSKSSRRSSR